LAVDYSHSGVYFGSDDDDLMLTAAPEMILTLTAWPTPAPVVTQPPTPTAEPGSLWTSELEPAPTGTPTKFALPTTGAQSTSSPDAVNQASAIGPFLAPSRIRVPALALDAAVVMVTWEPVLINGTWRTEWQTADGLVGHHRDSANPGQPGNIVLSGHHNTKGEVFRQVSEIGQPGSHFGKGDSVVLVSKDGREFEYEVVEWHRLREEGATLEERLAHADYLKQIDEATLTLITCWPYETNTHRVVVVAKLAP